MNWLRRNKEPDLRPTVYVVHAPNDTSRQYDIAPELGEFTGTPHREMLGMDVGRLYKYRKMDESTQLLYDSVRALDRGVNDVSILPHELRVGHEWREGLLGRVVVDWAPDFDAAVVDCLARHMGWSDGAQFTVRRQTSEELMRGMDNMIAQAVARGVEPPKGWPYKRSNNPF